MKRTNGLDFQSVVSAAPGVSDGGNPSEARSSRSMAVKDVIVRYMTPTATATNRSIVTSARRLRTARDHSIAATFQIRASDPLTAPLRAS